MPESKHRMARRTKPVTDTSLRALKRQRTVRLARLLSRAFYLRRRGRVSEMYNLICDEMVSLGGVYVKFLQGVLLNGKVMRQWVNPDRLKIFENLETEPLDIIGILHHELPSERLKQITQIQPQPFAAGSFGQVYLGVHANGKHIIIKVLRPQVRELLRHDLRLLGIFAKRFTAGEYKNISVKMDEAIRDFRNVTLRETDYVSEAEFAHELFVAYKGNPKMVIPETYMDLCTKHVIVQEYLGGVSAVDLLKMRENGIDVVKYVADTLGSDLDQQLITLGVESLRGAFTLPRVQGDPHPGNIRFLPDNKVGMIDFGISAKSPENKAAFFGVISEWSRMYEEKSNVGRLFEQFMRFFMSDLYRALRKLSSLRSTSQNSGSNSDGSQFNFAKELGRMMQEILHNTLGTYDLQELLEDGRMLYIFNNMVNKGNRFGLVVKLEASEILRASQTYMTLTEALGRRRVVMPQVLANVVQEVEAQYPQLRTETEDNISMTQALEIINLWLERVAMRDPALFDNLMRRIKLHTTKTASTIKVEPPTEPSNA
ncbi:MAG TPA: AarF/ABC1/UbiB kinase family protein [Candidatus Saccharimonadales bacterium]|nr:AarF/ABC1/UbiB kinase family protein [Candidatus Saccharimonadales bacterium]